MLEGMPLLSTSLTDWVNYLRRALYPPACVFCHAPVAAHHTCCPSCAAEIHVWPPYVCHLCGKPIPRDVAPGPCGHCLKRPPPQSQTVSLYTYAGPVRTAILDWKLHGTDAGLQWLIHAAEARLATVFSPDDLLLPVPMPLSRMRKVGRHHVADLCKTICDATGSRLDWRILRRTGWQPRQSSLRRTERWKNLRKAFRVDDDYCRTVHMPERLWVVDDISTTGATLHYACRTLMALGRPVYAFSLARISSKG